MKTSLVVIVLSFVAHLAWSQSGSVTVDADKKLNTDFSNYKTYAWSSQVDSKLDEGIYFLNDLVLKERIRNATGYEMDSRGYRKASQSPDLLVNFRVFEQPTTIKGYSGYGTTYWGTQEVREPEDTTSFQVERGTVIINLIDTKTGSMVWRGFASGLMDGNVFNKNEDKIKEAVHLIFEEYPVRADDLGNKK